MKKLATLLLAAGMVMGASAPADAADIKVGGFQRFTFGTASSGFQGQNVESSRYRMRLDLTIAASENLKGFTQFQIGTLNFGNAPKHGERDVQVRQMYIDWKVPATPLQVRMGRQALGLPADAFGGNNVLGAGWGPRDGIVVSAPVTDWLSLSALWARQADEKGNGDVHEDEKLDVFGLAADLKFNGLTVSPWVAYATMGEGVAKGVNSWDTKYNFESDDAASDSYYFGATATLTAFDPFKLVVSAAYGERSYNGDADKWDDRKGYSIEAKASYKLGFGTPILAGWYASGDDADDQIGEGHLPGINPYSSPTGTMFDACTTLAGGNVDRYTTLGTWGVQLGIEDMSFLKDLTHAATVTWIQGTNNVEADGVDVRDEVKDADGKATGTKKNRYAAYDYMTTSDSVVELALASDYKIYKNLTATLELAYMINDFDNSAAMVAKRGEYDEDDWRAHLTFTYKF